MDVAPPFKHWRATPDFQEFEFRFVQEASTRMAALLTGEAHVATLPTDQTAEVQKQGYKVVTGKVPDIRPYVQQAAVYVVPLRVGGGTRLKVLDAMASGKALVSTPVGCEGIEVVPGRDLVVADDAGRFAAETVTLLRDPARRRALGTAARQLVEQKYAWPVVGDMLMAAYAYAAEGYRERGQPARTRRTA